MNMYSQRTYIDTLFKPTDLDFICCSVCSAPLNICLSLPLSISFSLSVSLLISHLEKYMKEYTCECTTFCLIFVSCLGPTVLGRILNRKCSHDLVSLSSSFLKLTPVSIVFKTAHVGIVILKRHKIDSLS